MSASRLRQLELRRLDPLIKASGVNEVYLRLKESDSVRYAIGCMQPIDPDYTRVSIKECERVTGHIAPALEKGGVAVSFRFQGSVTNDTHVKAHSDIDSLIIHERFFGLEHPQTPTVPYKGDPLADLKSMRQLASGAVRDSFPQVSVDGSGARSVSLSGGSLRRKVDLVFANWFNSNAYVSKGMNEVYRGVQVLDINRGERIINFPFVHNSEIAAKDASVRGGLRKTVRLLKSLCYDSGTSSCMSSYDICALAWNMPTEMLSVLPGEDLLLVKRVHEYLHYVNNDDVVRAALMVPNHTRPIFCSGGASQIQLQTVLGLLTRLMSDIESEITTSGRSLVEARVSY